MRVRDCLSRIGGFDGALLDEVFKPIEGADEPFRYRNHMQYAIRDGRIGLLCAKSDELGEYDGRLIEYEIYEKIRRAAEEVFERAPTRLFDGFVLRGSERTKEVLAELVSSSDQPHEVVIRDAGDYISSTGLNDCIRNVCEGNGFKLNGLLFRISPNKASKRTRTGVRTTIEGVDHYDEIFCGKHLRVKAGSFFQVNTEQAEKLANKASEACQGAKVIYDLYCGCGTLGLAVKRKGQKLFGIEVVPEAVVSAKLNRSLALDEEEASECDFVCKDVLKADLNSLIKSLKILSPDCIIIDPPRKGLDIGVVKKLLDIGAPDICYVSCDPATLARDLKMLTRDYRIREITPVDLFPNASHVETVVQLSKGSVPSQDVKVKFSMENVSSAQYLDKPATYDQIKAYVKEHSGLNVSSLYIAQVKQKYRIIERDCYNLPKSDDSRQPKCPEHKEKAIVDALTYYKMI